MNDLVFGIAIMIGLSIIVFIAVVMLAKRWPRKVVNVGAVVALVLTIAFVWWLRDHPMLSKVLPFSNLIILGNFVPLGVGALAGFVWISSKAGAVRRSAMIAPLFAIGVYYLIAPLLGATAAGSNVWAKGVSLQTTPSTCSAACAATLLKYHGLDASEEEMTALCLTTEQGTYAHGLYRGLKIKAAGTRLAVDMTKTDFTTLCERLEQGPAIITLMLPDSSGVDVRYERDWGWYPGQPHTVVLFAIEGDDVLVGEPSIGQERWKIKSLEDLWTGQCVSLVKR